MKDDFDKVKELFESFGMTVLKKNHKFANGADLTAVNSAGAYRVEIKKVIRGTRSWRVKPVLKNRKNDDFVAVVFPSGYILLEPMKDYLKCCSEKGTRYFTSMVFD